MSPRSVVAAALWLASAANAQEKPLEKSDLVFRSEVSRVVVDAFVTHNGRPVLGLEAGDFEVLDNGVLQTDVGLLVARDLPLVATLVLDTSRSVRGAKLVELREAASAFMDELDDTDSVSVVTFGTHFRLLSDFTTDYVAVKASLGELRGGGATSLLDSLLFSLVHGEELGRRLVVVFSDGLDTGSWLAPRDVMASAERSDAVLFAVRASSGAGARVAADTSAGGGFIENAYEQLGERALREIVGATAGRVVSLRPGGSVTAAFEEILGEMRSRYLLVYAPTDATEGWHELTVRLERDSDATLRARAGYYYP